MSVLIYLVLFWIDQSALMIKILKGTYPSIPSRYSSDLSELIAEML